MVIHRLSNLLRTIILVFCMIIWTNKICQLLQEFNFHTEKRIQNNPPIDLFSKVVFKLLIKALLETSWDCVWIYYFALCDCLVSSLFLAFALVCIPPSSFLFLLNAQLSLTSELQPNNGSQLQLPRPSCISLKVIHFSLLLLNS